MKKLTVWALLATLVVAGSAFAARPGQIASDVHASPGVGSPATLNNDDSCDIGVTPAATLLLPYFEVDLNNPLGETTIFTITNTSNREQIAHVTLWTDYTFPVIDFNIYLTGYDVQSINLRDVIGRGEIAPPAGTSSTNKAISPRGSLHDPNPNIVTTNCGNLPGRLGSVFVQRMQSAFTLGKVPALGIQPACNNIGGVHENAVGYATIDVARRCGVGLPTEPAYFTTEIGFDNVLIGDYQQVDATNNFAQGNPMVHIRAIPEGLPVLQDTNFHRTFYSRFQGGATTDRRQPLPSTFAARWIQGGAGQFQTFYKIWREGVTTQNVTCANASQNVTSVTEFVRFDEQENFVGAAPDVVVSPPLQQEFTLPETSLTSVADPDFFPQLAGSAVGGWMYMNLDNNTGDVNPAFPQLTIASQNWVVVSMRAQGIYSVDFDAAWLGNGCSPEVGESEATGGSVIIGPAANNNNTIIN